MYGTIVGMPSERVGPVVLGKVHTYLLTCLALSVARPSAPHRDTMAIVEASSSS